MEDIDKTINTICEWIQRELDSESSTNNKSIMPEMIEALAKLISARTSEKAIS